MSGHTCEHCGCAIKGRCGSYLAPIVADGGATFCRLPHGHQGWHRGDSGVEWLARTEPVPLDDPTP